MNDQLTNLPRVTYSNTGEDFSGVHAHLDEAIPDAEARLFGKRRPALIGGRNRDDGRTDTALSPIDRDIVLGEFPQASASLVDEAGKLRLSGVEPRDLPGSFLA